MIHGLDTTLLVQVEVMGHPGHDQAKKLINELLHQGHTLALAPQVLAEFIHIVTDPRRFDCPLAMDGAQQRAQLWWSAREVVPVMPNEHTTPCFLRWLQEHKLGRKRLLDTLLAATYFTNDIGSILTTNSRDFRTFGCFEISQP